MAQKYGTFLFRIHTHLIGHEVVHDEESVIRLLDVRAVSATLKEDHIIVDRENLIELFMNI